MQNIALNLQINSKGKYVRVSALNATDQVIIADKGCQPGTCYQAGNIIICATTTNGANGYDFYVGDVYIATAWTKVQMLNKFVELMNRKVAKVGVRPAPFNY